jgi:hypothetical protein
MKTAIILLVLIAGFKSYGQLPSQRPMDEVYSKQVKEKVEKQRHSSSPSAQLPSKASLPQQAVAAKARTSKKGRTNTSDGAKSLPSNAKNTPAIRRPKKQ